MEDSKETAYITYVDGKIMLVSPYRAEYVSELKSGLKSRRWNPEKKCWLINIEERQKMLEIVGRHYKVVEYNGPAEKPTLIPPDSNEPKETSSGIEINTVVKPSMQVEIWTDGACVVNPGPGGYGIMFRCQGHEWERAGGFKLTTNNRMEIMGAIIALETIPNECKAIIYTDSQYLFNSVMKGWVKRWRSKGWRKKGNKIVPNRDLWERMIQLCANHEVEFRWIRGHSSNDEHNRCDSMAEYAARKPNLPVDEGYTGCEGE